MSVTSVRNAIKKATQDNQVSGSEAREILHIANRTSGINAGERAELKKAIESPAFDAYSKGIIEDGLVRATPVVQGPAALREALVKLVGQHGLNTVSGLKSLDSSKFPQAVKDACERFSAALDQNDGSTVADTARELRVGREKIIVVQDSNGERELFGFLDHEGRELGRMAVEKKDESITARWAGVDGKPGKVIATYDNSGDKVPAAFKKELVAFLKARAEADEEISTKELDAKDLPSPLRQQFEWMERNIADGSSAEMFKFQGKTIYKLNDWSCVSTEWYYTAKGTVLATATDGEIN